MKKYNKVLLIAGIIVGLVLIGGLTYAYYRWSSSDNQRAMVKVKVEGGTTVYFDGGTDISGTLYPTLTKEEGIIKTVSVSADSEDSMFSLWLKIEELPDELKDSSFIWEIWKNGENWDAYDFSEESILDYTDNGTTDLHLVLDEPVGTTTDTYTIYFWINGNVDNDVNMGGKKFNFELYASGVNAIAKYPNYLSNFISNKYNEATKTEVTSNDITYNYATSEFLMNDRHGSMSTSINDGNIRYYGDEPDNYIYFNCNDYSNQTKNTCELWRIIGVFDGKVKIVKDSSIGNYSWDSSSSSVNVGYGINEWSQADLMKLLNPGYENNYDLNSSGNSILVNNSLYWQGANGEAGYCYNAGSNATVTCDFTSVGLKNNTTRNMISTSKYYYGSFPISYQTTLTMDEIYVIEREGIRGDFSASMFCYEGSSYCTDKVKRTGTWNGKISLLSLSDYGYASDLNLCKNKTNENYTDEVCTSSNWIYYVTYNNNFILINAVDDYSKFATVVIGTVDNVFGKIANGTTVSNTTHIYPVLHLKSNVILTGGYGTSDEPYQINLNS